MIMDINLRLTKHTVYQTHLLINYYLYKNKKNYYCFTIPSCIIMPYKIYETNNYVSSTYAINQISVIEYYNY